MSSGNQLVSSPKVDQVQDCGAVSISLKKIPVGSPIEAIEAIEEDDYAEDLELSKA